MTSDFLILSSFGQIMLNVLFEDWVLFNSFILGDSLVQILYTDHGLLFLSDSGSRDNLIFRSFTVVFQSVVFWFLVFVFLVLLGFPLVPDGASVWGGYGRREKGTFSHLAAQYLQMGEGRLQAIGTKNTSWARHLWQYPLCQAVWPPMSLTGEGDLMTKGE